MFKKDRIKEKRVIKKLSLRDLEKISGVSYITIKNIEDGTIKNPSFEKVVKIAKSLDISLDELIDNEDNSVYGLWNIKTFDLFLLIYNNFLVYVITCIYS